jgi:ribosomal protein L24E
LGLILGGYISKRKCEEGTGKMVLKRWGKIFWGVGGYENTVF